MWPFFSSFNDPRWRRERIFYCILPVILFLTVGGLYLLLRERLFPVPETLDEPSAYVLGSAPNVSASQKQSPHPSAAHAETSNLRMAQSAMERGELASARIFLTIALNEKDPQPAAYSAFGDLELLDKNPAKAVENFDKAISMDARDPVFYYNRAEALRWLGKYPEAVADLLVAKELDRANPLYPNKILLTRMESGDRDAVFREVSTNIAVNVSAGQSDWLAGAAAIELQAGNTQHCLAYLETLRPLMTAPAFKRIIQDRYFDAYRRHPEFARWTATESAE